MQQPPDLYQQYRDITFNPVPTDQAVQAARILNRIIGVTAQANLREHRVTVQYHVSEHTLVELENLLCEHGFELDNHLLQKIKRALAHYCEEVQCDNLYIPEQNLKSRDIYVQVWEKHQHGDHDDTPEELRRYL